MRSDTFREVPALRALCALVIAVLTLASGAGNAQTSEAAPATQQQPATPAPAQEPAAQQPTAKPEASPAGQPPATDQPATAAPATTVPPGAADEIEKKRVANEAAAAEEEANSAAKAPKRFIPTQKSDADNSATFPVDI